MQRKLFHNDKNYILKSVQASSQTALVNQLVSFAKKYYLHHYNPLGLIDDTILKIEQSGQFPEEPFDEFYFDLATIYRFRFGEVQLQLLFDGSTHDERYAREWESFFMQNVKAFCANKFFLRAVLDVGVFHAHDRVAQLAGRRLKYFLHEYFELKVYKYRGVQLMKAS